MAKKGEWKLVRPTLSHPPAGPSWPQGAVSLVWRRDSGERHRQQPVLSSTRGISFGRDSGLYRSVWLAASGVFAAGQGLGVRESLFQMKT